jgi:hypothetical protein
MHTRQRRRQQQVVTTAGFGTVLLRAVATLSAVSSVSSSPKRNCCNDCTRRNGIYGTCDNMGWCSSHHCQHGSCNVNTCVCSAGWTGAWCTTPPPPPPCTLNCGAHGSQSSARQPCQCNCNGGWSGGTCNVSPCSGANDTGVNATPPLGLALTDVWEGPGDCLFKLQSGRTCAPDCAGDGKSPAGSFLVRKHRCEEGALIRAECGRCTDQSDPSGAGWCAHSGQCISNEAADGGYNCNCTKGWSGIHCELSDPCLIDRPCKNSGTCRDVSTNSAGYVCDCQTGYAGINCTTLITIWHTMCCVSDRFSCPLIGQDTTEPQLLRNASQTQHLCNVFSTGRLVVSLLVSASTVGVSLWAYRRLVLCRLGQSKVWALSVMGAGSCLCAAALVTIVYKERQGSIDLTGVPASVGLVCLALPVQVALAGVWHARRQCCMRAANTVTSRLWRGAMIPALAVVTACPAVLLVMPHYGQTTSTAASVLKKVARADDDIWVVGWLGLSFGVVVTMVPLAAVVGRVFMPHREPSQELLSVADVHRGGLFVWAHRGFAQLSGLLFPLFWIPYMANELQLFVNRINRDAGDSNNDIVSVDGVRAANPVVITLNFCVVLGFALAMLSFPAPQLWSPFVFVGIGWGMFVVISLVMVTCGLVWALAEPKAKAIQRHTEALETMRVNLLRSSFSDLLGQQKPSRCCGALCGAIQFATSWQGQTLLSTLNHLVAIAMFSVGIVHFSTDMRGTPIRKWLLAGGIMSMAGLLISMASLIERKWPWLKLTPTDDSFRLACVFKVALVMTKAMVVFLLAGVEDKSPSFVLWENIVSIICFVSLAILALMTAAFAVKKVWRQPKLLEKTGVFNPRAFIVLYAVSYVGCKFATIFFMAQGHMPSWFGCGEEIVAFNASTKFGTSSHSDAIDCIICYPSTASSTNATATRCQSTTNDVYYHCSSSCIQLFYSGEQSMDLVTFVLVPLLWLPFAVYANNEVAQLIDGTWWRHLNSDSMSSSSVKIGLSSTAGGYYTVAPLVQAVTVACGVILVWFVATTGGGYQIRVPPEMLETGAGLETQVALHRSGRAVTICAVLLNAVMMARVIAELCISNSYHLTRIATRSRTRGQELQTKMLVNQPRLS